MTNLPILIIIFPFLFALIIGIFGSLKKFICLPLALLSVFSSLLCSFLAIFYTYKNGALEYELGGWTKTLGIAFYLNSYNSILLFLVNIVAFCVLLYSRNSIYLKFYNKLYAFYSLLLFFLTGNLGIIITGDAFNLYVFLEIVSLSSYSMIALNKKESYVASLRYLIIGTVGASFYLLGVGLLYLKTGSLNMFELHRSILPLYGSISVKAAFILITLGLSIKVAFFPFHTWLPFAYSKTLNAVSVLMSPIVTKVSLFACIKIIVLVFGIDYFTQVASFNMLLTYVAGVGMIYFSIKAYSLNNIKHSFCYILLMECSLMFGGVALQDRLGLQAALYHLALDVVMTLSLFLFVVVLDNYYKVKNYSELIKANIFKQNKILSFSFLVTVFSVLGLPPTGGFFSKFYFLLSCFYKGQYFFAITILLSSIILLTLFLKVFEKMYFLSKGGSVAVNKSLPFIINLTLIFSTFFIFFYAGITSFIIQEVILPFLGL